MPIFCTILKIGGTNITTNIAGKINRTNGNNILIGAFNAAALARCRLRSRILSA